MTTDDAPDGVATRGRLATVAAVTALAIGAWWHKTLCLTGQDTNWFDTHWCFSDVNFLYALRDLHVDLVPYTPGTAFVLEYPPGMAFPAWLIALLVDSTYAFLTLTAVTMAGAAAVTVWASFDAVEAAGRDPMRVPWILVSPAVLLFAVQNWDLWSVAVVALGVRAAVRGYPLRAGGWFGVGAAIKWWPALLVVTLLAGPWSRRDGPVRRWGPAAVAAGVWGAIQVPALVVSVERWIASITFHLGREPNPDGHWGAIAGLGQRLAPGPFWDGTYPVVVDVLAAVGLVGGVGYVGWRLWRSRIDPGDAALALVTVFLLTSKVLSFQFVLWLLPVAVVATVPVRRIVTVEVLGCLVWILYAPWDGTRDGLLVAAQVVALLRAGALAWALTGAFRGPGVPPRPSVRARPSTGRSDGA